MKELLDGTKTPTIVLISRKALKKELRHNKVDKLYLVRIQEVSKDQTKKGITVISEGDMDRERVRQSVSRRITTTPTSYKISGSSNSIETRYASTI